MIRYLIAWDFSFFRRLPKILLQYLNQQEFFESTKIVDGSNHLNGLSSLLSTFFYDLIERVLFVLLELFLKISSRSSAVIS